MSNILAIEMSASACSVALLRGSSLLESLEVLERQQTRLILPQISQLLLKNSIELHQLQAIAFSCGPGSFTGIRLAASVVQGLAFAANLPVIPVSSLRTLAQAVFRETGAKKVVVAMNAFGGSLYWGLYQLDSSGIMSECVEDQQTTPEQASLPALDADWVGVGNAWDIYPQLASRFPNLKIYGDYFPRACDVVMIAQVLFAEEKYMTAGEALPVYLYGAERWRRVGQWH